MAKALTLDIAMNSREVVRGSKDIESALEKVADSLDDISTDGDKSTDRLVKSFSDAQRDISRSSKKIGDDVGDDVKRGTKKGEEGLGEFKDEANSTAREAAASFDGSAASIGDAFQEVAANAFAGFGPAGAAAGFAAALGLGAAMSAITAQQEAADELKQKLSDAYRSAAEEGRNYLDTAQVTNEALDIMFDKDTTRRDQARKDAAAIGIDYRTMIRAQAGDVDALRVAEEAATRAATKRYDEIKDSVQGKGAAYDGELQAIGRVQSSIEGLIGTHETETRRAEDAIQIQNDLKAKESERVAAGIAGIDQQGKRLQAYADQLNGLPAQKSTKVVVDTSQAERDISRFINSKSQLTISARVLERNGKAVP